MPEPPRPAASPDTTCLLLPGVPAPGGTIVIALAEAVSPAHAPVPTNAAERIVFRQLYETLVDGDACGRLEPALARAWTSPDGGRTWIFTLRDGARAWDGTAVTAAQVAASLGARADSAWALDERRLAVSLAGPECSTPARFARPELAVALPPSAGVPWPAGTGPARPLPAGDDLVCLASEVAPQPPAWERLVFRPRPGADPRDLEAEGADLLVVRDRALLGYFREDAAFDVLPLDWDRLYVLAGARRLLPPALAADPPRAELAHEVTAADALAAAASALAPAGEPCARGGWPVSAAGDSAAAPAPVLAGGAVRLAYPEADADARRLAERLAVLAELASPAGPAPAGRPAVVPTSLARAALASRLGDAAATAVFAIERGGAADAGPALPADLLPLVVTRAHLVARRGLAGLRLDSSGTLRLDRSGFAAAPPP
jgi:hypothetical protein